MAATPNQTAVDNNVLAIDEACFIASQVNGCTSYIVGDASARNGLKLSASIA